MNDLYLTCESKNCPRRAEPGRRYCVVCANRREFYRFVPLRIPNNQQTALALIGALVEAEVIVETMRQNVQRAKEGRLYRQHTGWWCFSCQCWAADLMRPCKCTTDIEDANSYWRFKAENWYPCYVELVIDRKAP